MTDAGPLPSIPRYEIVSLLGEGGMGSVYLARDAVLGRPIALKLPHHGPESETDPDRSRDHRRFRSEIRTLGSLHHEGIVRLLDVGRHAGRLFYSMEYLEGLGWDALIERPLPDLEEIRASARLFAALLEALEHVHRSRLLHRDLKPGNAMILPSASGGTITAESLLGDPAPVVKLMDFGLAIDLDDDPEDEAEAGTPLFMAPERAERDCRPDARSDIYSAGVFLYQTVTRRLPYQRLADALNASKTPPAPAELNPLCPAALSDLIMRQLSRRPHERSASADVLRHELLEAAGVERVTLGKLHAPVFCGRTAETEMLERTVETAATAVGGSLVLVGGPSGSGKSSLLDRSGLKVRAVLDHRLGYLEGRYDEDGPAHQGLRAVLACGLMELSARLSPESLAAVLGPAGGTLLDIFELGTRTGTTLERLRRSLPDLETGGSPGLIREQTIDAAVEILIRACKGDAGAGDGPRVVILKNLHWAETLDLEILGRLIRRSLDSPVLVIATHDSGQLAALSVHQRWLDELVESPSVRILQLGGLNDSAVEAMALSMLESTGSPHPELLRRLIDESQGRPQDLQDALRSLFHRGEVVLRDGRWRLAEGKSPGVEPALPGLDPRSLKPRLRELLCAVSVVPDRFDLATLTRLLEVPPTPGEALDGLRRDLAELQEIGLLERGTEGYRFASPGLRERCDEILGADRRPLHLRMAQLLLDSRPGPSDDQRAAAAEHFRLGGDVDRAREHHLHFARQAARRGSYHRALKSYGRVLELLDPGEERSRVLEERGRLHQAVGNPDAALEDLREAALSRPAGPELVSLLEEEASIHQRRGDLQSAEELCERGRSLADGDAVGSARLLFRLGSIQFDRGELDRAAELFERSLVIYRDEDHADGMASVLMAQGLIEKRRGDLDHAIASIEESIRCSERAGKTAQVAKSLNNLANVHRLRGDHARAIQSFRRSLQLREQLGDRLGRAICLNNLGRSYWYRGEVAKALEAAREALELFRELGDRRGVLISDSNVGAFRFYLGDLEGASRIFEANLELARGLDDPRASLNALHSLGLIENAAGNPSAEEAHLREGRRFLPEVADPGLKALFLAEQCLCCLRLDNREGARDALREALETVADEDDSELVGWLRYHESELALHDQDLDRALATAEEALAILERSGARCSVAIAHRQLARVYLELGPDWIDQTEKFFELAERSFEEMGLEVELGLTLVEQARLWALLDEAELADARLRRAAEIFRRCGASRRAEQTDTEREKLWA